MILGTVSCSKKEDHTKLSSSKVIELLEKKGYKFESSDEDKTHYVYFTNADKEDKSYVWIQKYDNIYVGTNYTFKKNDINDKHASIIDKEENKSKDEKLQYDTYLDWLDLMGLTKSQIINVLDYYDKNHPGDNVKSDVDISAQQRLIELGYETNDETNYSLWLSQENFGSIKYTGFLIFNFNDSTLTMKLNDTIYLILWNKNQMAYKDKNGIFYNYDVKTASWLTNDKGDDSETLKLTKIYLCFLNYLKSSNIHLSDCNSCG